MPTKLLEYITKRLVTQGLKKGATEGSFLWLAIAVLGMLFKFVLKQRKPKVITEKLRLGETITISHLPGKTDRDTSRIIR